MSRRAEWWLKYGYSRVNLEHFYESVRKALAEPHKIQGINYALFGMNFANLLQIDEPELPFDEDYPNHNIIHVFLELAASIFGFHVNAEKKSNYRDGEHFFSVVIRNDGDAQGYLAFLRWATPRLLNPTFLDLFYADFYGLVMHESPPAHDGTRYFMIAGFSANIMKSQGPGKLHWESFGSKYVCYILGKHDGKAVWEYRHPGSFPTDWHDRYRLPTECHSGLDADPRDTPDIEADMRDPTYHNKQHWEAEWGRLVRDPAAWEARRAKRKTKASGRLVAIRLPDKIYPFN
jgi:hypothetical protein